MVNFHFLFKASIFTGFIILSSPLQASDLQKRQSYLKQLQTQISKQQSEVKNTNKQRERLVNLLKQDEKEIASAAKKVNETKTSLTQTDKQLNKLNQRQLELNKLKKIQQESLSNQLVSAFLTGNHDYSKMLLNQHSPATIERLMTYYQYLNNARMASINEFQETIVELEEINQEQISQKDRLNKLILNQQKQAKQLTLEQDKRQNTLSLLQKTLNSHGTKLEQLRIEEASLKRVMEHAITAMKNSKMDGLSSKNKLSWPTKGRIKSGFGSQRAGQVEWKGVTISAPEGQTITAIAPGKVIYADWLRGFGMVLVVDHGKGYMSLYGHAQTLLKSAGDLINKGESVALVGRSGGQTEPDLYFEVRHKGQAVDPARYCKQ